MHPIPAAPVGAHVFMFFRYLKMIFWNFISIYIHEKYFSCDFDHFFLIPLRGGIISETVIKLKVQLVRCLFWQNFYLSCFQILNTFLNVSAEFLFYEHILSISRAKKIKLLNFDVSRPPLMWPSVQMVKNFMRHSWIICTATAVKLCSLMIASGDYKF